MGCGRPKGGGMGKTCSIFATFSGKYRAMKNSRIPCEMRAGLLLMAAVAIAVATARQSAGDKVYNNRFKIS